MSKALITEQYLTDIGDAIRYKNGLTTSYTPPAMAQAIRDLETAAAPNLQNKTVSAATTIVQVTADTPTYDGLGVVTINPITTAAQAVPVVGISTTTGLITATATQHEGYVEAGEKHGTLQLTTRATSTITPSSQAQYVQAGTYLTGLLTVDALTDGDALTYGSTTSVSNALVTKSLLDALATTIKNKASSSTLPMTIQQMNTAVQSIRTSSQISLQSKTVTPSGSLQVVQPDSGYDGLASVQVNAVSASTLTVNSNGTYIPASGSYYNGVVVNVGSQQDFNLQTKEVTPSDSPQSVTPDTGYQGLSSVTVKAIPNNYANVTNVNATVADVTSGKTFVDNTGTEKTGTLQVNSYYVRSTTPDSTLGSDGDLCLKI